MFMRQTHHVEKPGGGPGYIAGEAPNGLLTVNTVPSSRMIEVRHRASRLVIAVFWSASNGTYRLDGVNPLEEFDVIARDYAAVYNDVIVSRILPKAY